MEFGESWSGTKQSIELISGEVAVVQAKPGEGREGQALEKLSIKPIYEVDEELAETW